MSECVKCKKPFDAPCCTDENGYGYCEACCKKADDNERKYQEERERKYIERIEKASSKTEHATGERWMKGA